MTVSRYFISHVGNDAFTCTFTFIDINFSVLIATFERPLFKDV